jgi:hypothetical protein
MKGMLEMADYKFLDYDGLLVYHNELEKLFDKKLDIEQGVEHGNKFMMVNDTTGMLEPRPIGDLGQVDDVKVDGVSVVTDRVALIDLEGPLSEKQDSLSADELAVLAGKPFTQGEKDKLGTIASGAQVNVIESISVNGTVLVPDVDKEVEITVPTTLAELDDTGFTYVRTLTAGTPNVNITGDAPNLTITVDAFEMPDEFTSTETAQGAIGDALEGMDATILVPIREGAELSEGDVVIFANNIQAVVTEIFYDQNDDPETFDAIITRVPTEVTFAGIGGSPTDNSALSTALNAKMNTNMDNASLGTANANKYLIVDSGGGVTFGAIIPITNQEILALFQEEIDD